MFIRSFLQPFTGGPGQGVSCELKKKRYFSLTSGVGGRAPRVGLLCVLQAIGSIPLVTNLWQKQQNTQVIVKERDPAQSQIGFSLLCKGCVAPLYSNI